MSHWGHVSASASVWDHVSALELITGPTSEPVTLAEAKAHLVIPSAETDYDAQVQSFIAGARTDAERFMGRGIMPQTWTLWMDKFPGASWCDPDWDGVRQGSINDLLSGNSTIMVPLGQLTSVTHIKVYDNDDSDSTVSSSLYFVDTKSQPGRIVLRDGQTWPIVDRNALGIEIQFVCGWAASNLVPASIKQGILTYVMQQWENRGQDKWKLPVTPMQFYAPYRLWTEWP